MGDIAEVIRALVSQQALYQKEREARNKEEDATIKLLTDQIRLLTAERLAEVINDRQIAEENICSGEDENYHGESPVYEDFSNPEYYYLYII